MRLDNYNPIKSAVLLVNHGHNSRRQAIPKAIFRSGDATVFLEPPAACFCSPVSFVLQPSFIIRLPTQGTTTMAPMSSKALMTYSVFVFTKPLNYAMLLHQLAKSSQNDYLRHWGVLVTPMSLVDAQVTTPDGNTIQEHDAGFSHLIRMIFPAGNMSLHRAVMEGDEKRVVDFLCNLRWNSLLPAKK